jgi:hypothetical protein
MIRYTGSFFSRFGLLTETLGSVFPLMKTLTHIIRLLSATVSTFLLFQDLSGVNFTNLVAQRTNAPLVIFWRQKSFLFPVQFHQQIYAQLHYYKQLENMFNFYAVRPVLCASKFGVNLLVQKLQV